MPPVSGNSRIPEGYAVCLSRKFTILGKPVAKERARYDPRTRSFRTPAKTRQIEAALREEIIKQIPERIKDVLPWHGPVILNCQFIFHIQKYREFVHSVRPDADNLVKTVCDSLNDILWQDDGQVFDIWATKSYDRESPRIELQVFFLDRK